MDAAPATPDASNDIFSLSDDVLADKLAFIEEIGNGNWGSVWRCKPKGDPTAVDADDFDKVLRPRVAVKLVHRETKSKTSVARVKSLWNEMKIVRAFKAEPHPSVVSFYSFVITPSFALVTMCLLPALVPVEVEESTARGWFRYLLSGVEFLHRRGVVHNDIKPANILISDKNIPVLVDFGFAERYDLSSSSAFHSKVAYGTPEYLAPERAREIPHDTRKSDVWSLGVTFFEILIGRTPFEGSDQEQFSTKEDLEKYWSRTLRGQWIGDWKMSRGMEKLLRRMISPNADLRCTISQAMKDTYWTMLRETDSQHRARISTLPLPILIFPQVGQPAMHRQLCSKRTSRNLQTTIRLPLRARGLLPRARKTRLHLKASSLHSRRKMILSDIKP
ncbi:kinase-like protein [Cylindrobasidium torrendii FP15055 ss-10]|uniref:Kinase-like protein n=1 Tax=Cylindrobasidium torrendii FP15055 ss-10 TaxID=1314674 RepID=A0A0D7BFA8_9AGAR|nr:kinase-like protein [Cylindrobasidium torrendii FP15055 ss-10]